MKSVWRLVPIWESITERTCARGVVMSLRGIYPPSIIIRSVLFFSADSLSFPPEVIVTTPHPLSFASSYNDSISDVLPEYELTMTNVFLFAHLGNFCTLSNTIGIGEIGEYRSVAILPTIPEPPIPPIIISLNLRKTGCITDDSESITLFKLVSGFSIRICFFVDTRIVSNCE